jgi:hypothetical protein
MTNDAGDPTFDPRWNGAAIAKDDWHFHRRLLTRYGVVLGPGEYSKIQKKIRKGRYKIPIYRVYTPSAPRGFYVLSFGGRLLTAWPPAAGDRLKALSEQRSSESVSKMSEMFNASDQQVHVDAEVQESNKASLARVPDAMQHGAQRHNAPQIRDPGSGIRNLGYR